MVKLALGTTMTMTKKLLTATFYAAIAFSVTSYISVMISLLPSVGELRTKPVTNKNNCTKTMKKLTTLLTLFILLNSTFHLRADSWIDPSWEEMMDSSDVIVLVEYISSGDFRAKAKPITIYKGQLSAKEIWISGFSNRYGPIDSMQPGDRYIVFLNFNEPTERRLAYWTKKVKEEPELAEYIEAVKAGNAYYVWSPTSGDLKVKNQQVRYDLLQTSYYGNQEFHPLDELEEFLKTTGQKDKTEFHRQTLKKVQQNASTELCAQYLMMLYLSSFESYDPIFKKIADQQLPESNYALAKLLGQVATEASRDLLLQLLNHENSIVQGEVVRQLSIEDAEFVGPILLAHLNTAGEGGIYPSNIMDPVMNQIDGGKIEIIKTLGKLQYKPSAPELLPLLETEDEYLFRLVIEVLSQLGSKEYVPYINRHLENGTRELIYNICTIITEDSLEACVPSLMKFVATHDKSIHPSMEYTISQYYGLAHFKTDTVKKFLNVDFQSVLKMEGGGFIDNKEDWMIAYLDVFQELGLTEHKDEFYDSLFEHYGLNTNFKQNSAYFQRKQEVEDSLINIVSKVFKPLELMPEISALAFIDSNFNVIDYSVKYEIEKPENFEMWGGNKLDTLNNLIVQNTTIDLSHLIWSTRAYTGSDGAKSIQRFGDTLLNNFLDYISSNPDQQDIEFLKNLQRHNYAQTDYEKKKLMKFIEQANKN